MKTLHLSASEDEDEARMRRALSVGTSEGRRGGNDQNHGPRPARQFAQDGDVPVVRLSGGRKDQPAHAASARLEELLAAERLSREQAEAALRQANAALQALQTKSAHAEMARAEALAAQARDYEAKLAALTEELDRVRAPAPAAPAQVKVAEPVMTEDAATKDGEHEPVQWWVPGWREGRGRRT